MRASRIGVSSLVMMRDRSRLEGASGDEVVVCGFSEVLGALIVVSVA